MVPIEQLNDSQRNHMCCRIRLSNTVELSSKTPSPILLLLERISVARV